MKKKHLIILLLLLSITLQTEAQNTVEHKGEAHIRTYLKLKDLKKKFPEKKIEFIEGKFHVYKNDTLILVEDTDYLNRVSIPYEFKDEAFLDIYKDLVYNKSVNATKEKPSKEYMRLWKKPIKIFFASSLDNYYKNTIVKAAKNITKKVDSLHISFADNAENANYIVYQVKDENSVKYTSNLKGNPYINYYMYWRRNKIYDNVLEINLLKYKHLPKEIHANYILQNFYGSLGRFYKTNKLPCSSMFSLCNRGDKKLTSKDLELLQYHYSYGICKFTDLKTFEENHRKSKESLKEGHKVMFSHMY